MKITVEYTDPAGEDLEAVVHALATYMKSLGFTIGRSAFLPQAEPGQRPPSNRGTDVMTRLRVKGETVTFAIEGVRKPPAPRVVKPLKAPGDRR